MPSKKSPDPKVEKVRQILRSVVKSSHDVRAAAVIRLSGLTVAAVTPHYVEQEQISAMSAVMLLLGERITSAMRSGELAKVYIQGATGHIVLIAIGGDAVLTVMAEQQMPLGLLLLEMQLAIEKLKPLV